MKKKSVDLTCLRLRREVISYVKAFSNSTVLEDNGVQFCNSTEETRLRIPFTAANAISLKVKRFLLLAIAHYNIHVVRWNHEHRQIRTGLIFSSTR